ncbi:MAG: hypothetical protein FWE83_08340 [Oscillospiraceae bacterium]|nr:hypothetical protein [Oscillospiraceae bacterium]
MVIQSYEVKTSSQRTFLSVESTNMLATREIRIPQNANQPQHAGQAPGPDEANLQLERLHGRHHRRGGEDGHFRRMHRESVDERIRELARKLASSTQGTSSRRTQNRRPPRTPQELKAELMRMMIELLTGKNSNSSKSPEKPENETGRSNFDLSSFFGGGFGIGFGNAANRPQVTDGWRVEHFQFESEQVSYQAQGIVKTADGRTINVDINMFMSRQFVSYMGINIETTRPIDPLVINYGGTAASLMGDRFMFDLTSDGNLDSLAVLGEGSGFLAIDWNGDGKIHDGSQLFGPSTGCGFSELRQYDKDGNGWIDANDEIFDKLVVWHRDKDGNDTVFTLRELGIGAIYLGDIATEFSFKDENNQTLGIMRSTSFFLKECGGAGTVSHIDMMI